MNYHITQKINPNSTHNPENQPKFNQQHKKIDPGLTHKQENQPDTITQPRTSTQTQPTSFHSRALW